MNTINQVYILGNMTADPEVKETPNGSKVCEFSVATNEPIKRGDEWDSEPEFHNVVLWQHRAEFCGKFAKKGSKVAILGRLKTESWEDKDSGKKAYRTKIIAREFILLSKEKKNIEPEDSLDI